jgi:dipeptidase E
MQLLYSSPDLHQVLQLQAILEAEGHPCTVRNEYTSAIGKAGIGGMPELWLLNDQQLTAAKILVSAFLQPPLTIPSWSGSMILTSTGLSHEPVLAAYREALGEKAKQIAIITTAARDKERNQWSVRAAEQITELGHIPTFIDLELADQRDLNQFEGIYVCGGNTFYLLKWARQSKLGEQVLSLLERGGSYLGVSAGSIIPCPSIAIAAEVNPDPYDPAWGVDDLTGMNLVPFHIGAHYQVADEPAVVAFEQKHTAAVERVANDEAVLISEGVATRVGL